MASNKQKNLQPLALEITLSLLQLLNVCLDCDSTYVVNSCVYKYLTIFSIKVFGKNKMCRYFFLLGVIGRSENPGFFISEIFTFLGRKFQWLIKCEFLINKALWITNCAQRDQKNSIFQSTELKSHY